jgi:hypothetical protein
MTSQGGAVTAFSPPVAGSASVFDVPPPLLELPLLPDELIWTMHGGTITRWMSDLSGITSWFCVLGFWVCACSADLPAPPGLRTTVPAPVELAVCPDTHGWTATVCASDALGTTTWFEPGGMSALS